MIKRRLFVIVIIFFICIISISYHSTFPNKNKVESSNPVLENNKDIKCNDLKKEFIFTEKPWGNDPSFKEAILKNEAFVLMAEFKSVLQDPLPGEMYNVGHAAEQLAGTVLKPGEIFSQNKRLGPYTADKGYKSGPMYQGANIVEATGGGVCKIASSLYNVAILSNLKIIERYNHSMPVPYVPPGQDATVYYGAKDFRFQNNTEGPIVIWAKAIDNVLYTAIYGQKEPPKVTWHHKILKQIKFWNIYKKNANLPKGTEKVIIPGEDGLIVSTCIDIEYPDGKIETKKMGKNYYNPIPQLIEIGTK